ncbi:MAG: hypothetical protein WDO19_08815 [Bacteroidota bacterium]
MKAILTITRLQPSDALNGPHTPGVTGKSGFVSPYGTQLPQIAWYITPFWSKRLVPPST